MTQSVVVSDRQSVIAVHGSASTGAQWGGLADLLAKDFDVHTPDLPGYGKSHKLRVIGRPTLYGDAVQIAARALQAPAPVHLIGHSYGAAVALNYAIENPSDVASLTLIEPTLFHLLGSGHEHDAVHYSEISAVANSVRSACLKGAPADGMSRFIDYWNGGGTWEETKPYFQARLAGQAVEVSRNFTATFAETWPAARCQRVECPTLIITGLDSPAPTRRVAEIVTTALPNVRHELIAGVGHMAPMTHPDVINPLIAEALDAASPSIGGATVLEAA
ncbi:MAG: alpha/beta hydrolase [Hyphomicrobiaceae bacterium]